VGGVKDAKFVIPPKCQKSAFSNSRRYRLLVHFQRLGKLPTGSYRFIITYIQWTPPLPIVKLDFLAVSSTRNIWRPVSIRTREGALTQSRYCTGRNEDGTKEGNVAEEMAGSSNIMG